MGDAFALKFFTAFMLNVGFTKTEIGLAVKAVLTTGSVAGAVLGGIWMIKLGLRRAMLLFAFIQALTNLGYLLLHARRKELIVMFGAVALDALASGMGNIAAVALMMALCDKRFSAFQYALLSMMALLPRYTLGGPAGYIADHGGWGAYYWTSFALALPGDRARVDHAPAHRAARRAAVALSAHARDRYDARVVLAGGTRRDRQPRFLGGRGRLAAARFLREDVEWRRGLRELLPARGASTQLPARTNS